MLYRCLLMATFICLMLTIFGSVRFYAGFLLGLMVMFFVKRKWS